MIVRLRLANLKGHITQISQYFRVQHFFIMTVVSPLYFTSLHILLSVEAIATEWNLKGQAKYLKVDLPVEFIKNIYFNSML